MVEYVAALDLYYLLVEGVFGSVFLAGVGLAVMFIVIGILSKMSPTLIIWYVGFFIMVFTIGYIGALGAVIFGILSLYYAYRGFINWWGSARV